MGGPPPVIPKNPTPPPPDARELTLTERPPRRIPLWAQLLVLVVVAGAVGHLVARVQGRLTRTPTPSSGSVKVAVAPRPSPVPSPSPSTTAVSTALPAPSAPAATDDLPGCVKDALYDLVLSESDIAPICGETNANRAVSHVATVLGTNEHPKAARRAFSRLAWYRMAKLQVVRTRCCGDVPPLRISTALSACGLDEGLALIDVGTRKGADLTDALRVYHKAADCLFKANTMHRFGTLLRPDTGQRDLFTKSITR